MKPKHTPGPWRVGDAGYAVFGPKREDGALAETIATVRKPRNARLIAAAPEMYAMLKRLSAISTLDPDWDEELLSLLDNVEGGQ